MQSIPPPHRRSRLGAALALAALMTLLLAPTTHAEGNTAEADRFDDLAKIALRRQVSFEDTAKTLETQVVAQTELADKLKDGLNKLRVKREERIRHQEAQVRGREEVAASSLEEQFASLESDEDELEVETRLAELKSGG